MGNCVRREVGLDFDNQPGSIDKMRERIVYYNIFLNSSPNFEFFR